MGTKGSNIQGLKSKSGCTQIRMMKESTEYNSQPLRSLIIEGHLDAIKRAHYCVQELLCGAESPASYGGALGSLSYANYPQQLMPLTVLMNYGETPTIYISNIMYKPYMVIYTFIDCYIFSLGVNAEIVQQARQIQLHLAHYGLDLGVMPLNSGHTGITNHFSPAAKVDAFDSNDAGGKKVVFYIPSDKAGGIIGKGGSILKEISAQFGVKVYVERDDTLQGVRKVSVRGDDEGALSRAHDHILLLSQQVQSNPPTEA